MRKIRKLSFFGVLGVVIAVLFLISISFTQAQVQTKGKPDKPGKPGKEEATWAVRIPTLVSDYMFYGIGDGYYENNDVNIKVSVEKKSPGAWRRYFKFVYAFDFTLTNENVGNGNPPTYQVGFQNVGDLYEVTYPDEDKLRCQFPGTGIGDSCMAAFLNGTHPHAGGSPECSEEDYQYFWYRIKVFDYDIESMQPGESYLFGSAPDPGEPGDYLKMVARYRQECYPDPIYHDVELYRSINWFRAQENGNPQNIEIKRLDATYYEEEFEIECDGVWRIWVHPNGHYGITGFLNVFERYCTIEKNKTKWYYPMEAKGNFSFYIDFIKNPTTQ
jgi:hypothetical protein